MDQKQNDLSSEPVEAKAVDEILYNLSLSVEDRLKQHQQALDLRFMLEELRLQREKSQ